MTDAERRDMMNILNPEEKIRNKRDYERDLGLRRKPHPKSRRWGKHATQRGQKGAFGSSHWSRVNRQ